MPFSDIATKINEAQDRIDAIKKEVRNSLASDIKMIFDEMFNKYPHFHGFSFAAYTPYFNDGDPCVFGYHGFDFLVDREFVPDDVKLYNESWIQRGDGWESGEMFWRKPENKGREWDNFVDDLYAINQILKHSIDFIQLIWGDHIRVTFTRIGVEVDGYDHN